MDDRKFAIPADFQDQLRYAPCPDARTDAEILAALAQHQPTCSTGASANVIDCVRINGQSGWSIRILDTLPDSPNNALKFIPPDMLPSALVSGTMDGPYVGPYSADFLRGACLYLYGGVYMDVGNLRVREMDRICWSQLEDPASPFRVCTAWMYGTVMANHFVAARRGDPFLKRWHDLFMHLWQTRTNHSGLLESPLSTLLQESMTFEESRPSKFHWNFSVDAKTTREYITQVLCWQRLCALESTDGDPFSGVEYWTKHVLIFDVLEEDWGGEAVPAFPGFGQGAYDLLRLPLDIDAQSQDYKDAYKLVWHLLAQCTMQKITHGKGLTNDVALGVLGDQRPGADSTPGTFAELLRYGTLNFVQTRESIRYVEAPRSATTLKKGLKA